MFCTRDAGPCSHIVTPHLTLKLQQLLGWKADSSSSSSSTAIGTITSSQSIQYNNTIHPVIHPKGLNPPQAQAQPSQRIAHGGLEDCTHPFRQSSGGRIHLHRAVNSGTLLPQPTSSAAACWLGVGWLGRDEAWLSWRSWCLNCMSG